MAQTPEERIDILADFFTGKAVAMASVGLQAGGDRRLMGEAFFEARNALNVSGWMGKEDAKFQIAAALGVNL